jgi:small GTP-binding protein
VGIINAERYLFKAHYSITPIPEKTLRGAITTVFRKNIPKGKARWGKWFLLWQVVDDSYAFLLLLDQKESNREKEWRDRLDYTSLILMETFLPAFIESRWYPEDPVFEKFQAILDDTYKTTLQAKICLIGEWGVGKSTILKLLANADPKVPPAPTIGVDIEKLRMELTYGTIALWDFSGQLKYRDLWRTQMGGSDIILLIVDSTDLTVQPSKQIILLVREVLPNVPLYVIANKQDLPKKYTPRKVASILGLPTLGLIAIEPKQRTKLVKFLESALSLPKGSKEIPLGAVGSRKKTKPQKKSKNIKL